MELGAGGKGKENDWESTIWKHNIYVQAEDVMMCIESCWNGSWVGRDKGK
jgi:hypothetical protein